MLFVNTAYVTIHAIHVNWRVLFVYYCLFCFLYLQVLKASVRSVVRLQSTIAATSPAGSQSGSASIGYSFGKYVICLFFGSWRVVIFISSVLNCENAYRKRHKQDLFI